MRVKKKTASVKKTKARILVVEARFYDDIADLLLAGAQAQLQKAGADVDILSVPGALEIPAAVGFAATAGKYDGYVVLGTVIRGETTHYDIVSNESARALQTLSLVESLAIGNGILTVENRKQALERADMKRMDKGGGAAQACLRMIEIKKQFGA